MAKLSSTHIYGDLYVDGTISGALSGNASTATKLQTARTINGTSFNGSSNITTANWGTARTITIGNTGKSVNGSGNVSWTLAEIGAAASSHGTHLTIGTGANNAAAGNHTHNYLPLSGGTLTGNVTLQHGTASKEAQYVAKRTDTGVGVFMGVGSGGENHGVYSQKLDKWMVYADGSKIYLQGNADTATKLATTRAIKIGNKSLNFDGSAAITYTLSDIGAAAKDHGTHLSLGTTSSTAYRGDYGNTAYKHSQAAHAPSNAQKNSDITKAEIEAKLTGAITSHTHNYAPSSHGHNEIWVKDAPFNSSNDTTSNWGGQGVSVSWYPDGKTITNKPNNWGFIFNIGSGSEVHQMWFTQASGTTYHRGGNGSGWSGSWRAYLDEANFSNYAAPASHSHSNYLSTSGGTLSGPVQVSGESRFHNGNYSDPWSGTGCAIKATGNVGLTGTLRANAGIYSTSGNGATAADGSKYAALLRYKDSRGYCDLGNNDTPGRLYIRSGQGTAGSGVLVECAVTNGNAYMQYLSPEAGTIALTRHLSDRTRKDNIVYVDSKDSEFTNKDFYEFIKNDLGLATYNLKKEYASTDTHTKLNFIAQDILWDFEKNEENKVGNLIVQAEDAMDQQLSLKYDPEVFTSVIAGALKESINKIEELEDKNKKLEERLAMLEEKFSALENK